MSTATAPSIQYRITGLTWQAPSASRAGATYTVEGYVDRTLGEPVIRAGACMCPDHRHRHRTCKHMIAAERGIYGKPHGRAVVVRPQRDRCVQAIEDLYGAA